MSADLINHSRKTKCWWKTVKHFLKRNHTEAIPSLLHDDKHISDNTAKAEIFNSQCNIDTSDATVPDFYDRPNFRLDSLNVSEQEVLDTLLSLDTTKATGPDNISTKLLKEAAPIIAPSLTRLFNVSLVTESYPSAWKRANVLPLYKKGQPKHIITTDLYLCLVA